MTRRLPALALLGLLAGCAGGEPSPSASTPSPSLPSTSTADPSPTTPGPTATRPIPRSVTPADAGSTFTMPVGASSELLIRDPTAPDPVVTGNAIELVPVVNVTDSGVREWELRAVTAGSSTIRGSSPGFVVTVIVR